MAGSIGTLFKRISAILAAAALLGVPLSAAHADDRFDFEAAFDRSLGTAPRAPRTYDSPLEARIAALAKAAMTTISVL